MKSTLMKNSPQFNTGIESWNFIWQELGCKFPPAALHQEVVNAYSELRRQYHSLAHLEECLTSLSTVQRLCSHASEVAIALWFHDAIYDSRRDDNEEQSASWAERATQAHGMSQSVSQRIRALVLATKHSEQPQDPDAKILVDIDLSILGATEERFNEYEAQVRQEYGWVPEVDFRKGRQRILESLLSRSAIYSTEYFHDLLEAQARSNLRRSLVLLKKT
jgi:predicted metal-dependent HD superfamily phosphohydrolase